MRAERGLAALMFSVASILSAQGAGSFQISSVNPPAIGEPLPCPPPLACEVYSRINVIRVCGTTGTVSVDLIVTGGTATPGIDYDLSGGIVIGPGAVRLNFADGSAMNSAVLIPKQDYVAEPSETVNLQLSNPTGGATIGSPSTATVTILDTSGQIQVIPVLSPLAYSVLGLVVAFAGAAVLWRRH